MTEDYVVWTLGNTPPPKKDISNSQIHSYFKIYFPLDKRGQESYLKEFPQKIISENKFLLGISIFHHLYRFLILLPPYYRVYNFCCYSFKSSGNCIPNMSNLSTHKCARNESNTLKYSTRPRQVILFPLISLISRLSGLSSQGMSIFKFLMNSSSISTSKSTFIIFKILSSPPCHTIIHPLISSVSSPVIKLSLSYHLNTPGTHLTHFSQGG